MNPTLPGALVEREKICDLCDCPAVAWDVVEMYGCKYLLCESCQHDHEAGIHDALAKADSAGREEDEAQEGE